MRFASCMIRAASVSLYSRAMQSSDCMLSSGLRRAFVSGALTSPRNVSQGVAWRRYTNFSLPLGSVIRYGLAAGPMKIQVGIELTLVKPVDVPGVRGGNVAVAHVFAKLTENRL